MKRFNINGDLWYAMLDHVLLVSYDYSRQENNWVAFARSYRDEDKHLPFKTYRMDSNNIFRTQDCWDGREPLLLKRYKKKYGIKPGRPLRVPPPPKLGDVIWHKGMTMEDWEAINGPNPVAERLRQAIDVETKKYNG